MTATTSDSAPRRVAGQDGPGSFAYVTITKRLPVILTKAIDALSRQLSAIQQKSGKDACDASKAVLGSWSQLRNELMTDKVLTKLADDGEDLAEWNTALDEFQAKVEAGTHPGWMRASWLLCECYMYRRVHHALLVNAKIGDYDPFQEQKETAFASSLSSMNALATFFSRIIDQYQGLVSAGKPQEAAALRHENLSHLIQLSLWGNRVDLSLLAKFDGTQDISGLHALSPEQLEELDKFILVNDLSRLVDHFEHNASEASNRCLAIVLDNSGFELFTDLTLADFLLSVGLVGKVKLMAKAFPWFVSDNTPRDVRWTVKELAGSNHADLAQLGKAWQQRLDNGSFAVSAHRFFTLPHEFSKMVTVAPDLYAELGQAHCILFKGDLNYRKLTADRRWPHTTDFKHALDGFLPAPLWSLRTLKAEVVVGLQPGQAEKAAEKTKEWLSCGEFGVIQMAMP